MFLYPSRPCAADANLLFYMTRTPSSFSDQHVPSFLGLLYPDHFRTDPSFRLINRCSLIIRLLIKSVFSDRALLS